MKQFNFIMSCLAIILGSVIAGFSVACILLPNDAIDYGTAGIAIIISKLTGFNLSLCVACTMLPFLIAGFLMLGLKFEIKAILGVLGYTLSLAAFKNFNVELNTEHFLAVAFGGALLGIGLSIILKFGGCIDGSEIFANILVNKVEEKTGRNVSMTGILIAFNALVYISAFFVINKDSAMLGLLVYIVANVIIDHFTDRFEAIKKVTIITQTPEPIVASIKHEFNKTCTLIDSYGAIAGENKTLICYITYFELQKMREVIKKMDTKAFITVSTVDEIIK